MDQYNFDAPEGMELKVFERLMTVDEQAMMVSEVPGPRHVSPNLSGSLLEADMVDSETAVDILTEGHDVSRVAESPIYRASCVTDGDGVAFYYEGDLSDSDCGSTGDRERDTWDDWCDSAFRNGYSGFPPNADDHSHRLCSVISCFGMTTLPSRHECCRTVEMRHCRHRQFSWVN